MRGGLAAFLLPSATLHATTLYPLSSSSAAPPLLLHRRSSSFLFSSKPSRTSWRRPSTTSSRFGAFARPISSAMASSYKPEDARVPPALDLPPLPVSKFKVALCQLSVTADKERNIAHARKAIEEAADKGAQLVLLPEIWNSPYSNDSFLIYAEDIEAGGNASPSSSMLSEVACSRQITIVGGSIPERSGDRLYNTCCVFGTDGKMKGKHRKTLGVLT